MTSLNVGLSLSAVIFMDGVYYIFGIILCTRFVASFVFVELLISLVMHLIFADIITFTFSYETAVSAIFESVR